MTNIAVLFLVLVTPGEKLTPVQIVLFCPSREVCLARFYHAQEQVKLLDRRLKLRGWPVGGGFLAQEESRHAYEFRREMVFWFYIMCISEKWPAEDNGDWEGLAVEALYRFDETHFSVESIASYKFRK